MKTILDIVTILCIGLMIGVELAVWVFIGPILKKLDEKAEAQATRMFGQVLGAVMPFWYVLSFVLLLAETLILRRQPGMVYLTTASALWMIAILLSVLVLVPINNRIVKMETPALRDSLRTQHQRWETVHRWRVLAIGAAMVCLLLGIGV